MNVKTSENDMEINLSRVQRKLQVLAQAKQTDNEWVSEVKTKNKKRQKKYNGYFNEVKITDGNSF